MRKRLEGTPIRPGILVQNTMGHGWPGQEEQKRDWPVTVTIEGIETGRQCPSSAEFRKFVTDGFSLLAKEKPSLFLVDDDFRLNNNSANGLQCFCRNCIAELNRRSDLNDTREQWRNRLKTSPGDDKYVRIFEEYREELLFNFAKEIREAIDRVDPAIRCGFCASGGEYRIMRRIAGILAGSTRPFLRIYNNMFLEVDAKPMAQCVYITSMMVKKAAGVGDILDESDTFNHSLYAKSCAGLHAHLTFSFLNGTNGAKLWLVKMEDIRARNPQYVETVGKYRGFYRTLINEYPTLRREGPLTVLPELTGDDSPTAFRDFLFFNDWQWQIFYLMGIAARYTGETDKDTVYLLTANLVKNQTDEKLREMLSCRVLCDGAAAVELTKRGFGKYLGITIVDRKFSGVCEKSRDNNVVMEYNQAADSPAIEPASADTEILSDLLDSEFNQSDTVEGVGATVFNNELGGRVAVTTLSLTEAWSGLSRLNLSSPARRDYYLSLLGSLMGRELPLVADADQDIYLIYGKRPDGSRMAAMFNLNYDALKSIVLRVDKTPKEVALLSPEGTWEPAEFTVKGNKVKIAKPLAAYEPAVMLFRYCCQLPHSCALPSVR